MSMYQIEHAVDLNVHHHSRRGISFWERAKLTMIVGTAFVVLTLAFVQFLLRQSP